MLWGHRTDCTCPICRSVARIFLLVREGSQHPGFIAPASERFRVLESELRDILLSFDCRVDILRPLPEVLPLPVLGASPAGSQPAAEGVRVEPRESETPRNSGKGLPGVAPKAKAEGNFGKAEPGEIQTKVEAEEDKGGAVHEVEDLEEKKEKSKRGREKERKRSRSRRKSKERRRLEQGEGKERKKRRGEESEEEKKSTGKGEETSPSGKKDRGEERTPDRRETAERSVSVKRKGPKPPGHPPHWHRESGARSSGWRGHIPYSDHPRWYKSVNKGIVKRAKQERWNSRFRWRSNGAKTSVSQTGCSSRQSQDETRCQFGQPQTGEVVERP